MASQGRGHTGLEGLKLVEAEHARAARPHEHQPRIDDPWRRGRRDLAEAPLVETPLVRAELRGEAWLLQRETLLLLRREAARLLLRIALLRREAARLLLRIALLRRKPLLLRSITRLLRRRKLLRLDRDHWLRRRDDGLDDGSHDLPLHDPSVDSLLHG